jgi:hypothetical protein
MNMYPLGRVVQHDPRSKQFAYKATPGAVLVSIRHPRFISVLDQLELGSCTGNAALGAVGSAPHFPLIKSKVADWSEDTAVGIYSDATVIDEWEGQWPPTDTGSSGLAVAKVLQRRGWISGYRHTFSLEDMKAALQETPVLLGINWYENFFYPDRYGFISIEESYVAGGHEICVDEINMDDEYFGFTNSWGDGWGVQGRGKISFALMARLLSEDGDVVVPVPVTQPAPTPDPVIDEPVVPPFHPSLWQRFLAWLTRLFGGQ